MRLVQGALLCACLCERRGQLKSKAENASHYEHYPLPDLAVKGTGINPWSTQRGGWWSGYVPDGNKNFGGGAYVNMCSV